MLTNFRLLKISQLRDILSRRAAVSGRAAKRYLCVRRSNSRCGSERGSAALEIGLMFPGLVFTFMGALDFGFSAYSLIATENAARGAATWGAANATNAANISSSACSYAAPLFKYGPTPVTCGSGLSVSTATPSIGSMQTVQVSVTYTVKLLQIPGLIPASLAITRTAQMPVR